MTIELLKLRTVRITKENNPLAQTACHWLRQHAGENAVIDFDLRLVGGQSILTALCSVTTLSRRQAKTLIACNFGFTRGGEDQ